MEFYKKKDFAQEYLQYRPNYPNEIYDKILGYLDEDHSTEEKLRKVAVDVGCGSGQSTLALSKYFDKVIGIDSSDAQLEEARKSSSNYSNISFIHGSATDLSAILKDHHCGSVDLITVASALHWFDVEPFYQECLRILTPGGVLAAFCYENPRFDNSEADHLFQTFSQETLKDYWLPPAKHAFNHYHDLFQILTKTFPKSQRDDSTTMPFKQSIKETTGFLNSFSGCQRYREQNPQILNPLDEFHNKLQKIYSSSSPDEPVMIGYFEIFTILGKKT